MTTVQETRSSADLTFPARDGQAIAATLFRARGPENKGAVIIGSAMGVRRGFYARYALFLRQCGFTVLTFDYREIGDSRIERGSGTALHDWGELDLTGAIDWLAASFDGPIGFVAHSVSGQMLGLCENNDGIAAAVLVAPQSGYWGHWSGFRQLQVAGSWYVAIPLLARLFGRLPGWFLGGADLPSGVAREWAEWGRHPDYILSHRPDTRDRFARVRAPMLVFGMTDDPFAPPVAVDALVGFFTGTAAEWRTLDPGATDGVPIGHFGFFNNRFARTIWRESADWLSARMRGADQVSA